MRPNPRADTNPFTDIQVSVNGLITTIQYKVDPLFTGKAPYQFQVQAFEDNSFTQPLYAIDSTGFFAVDDTLNRQNSRPSFLYKVKLITADKKVYSSNFVGWHPSDHVNAHKYLLANEISRREQVRFNYAGMAAYLLKRKSYSPEAVGETDPLTGEPVIDSRSGSFGVGIAGGYYTPVICRFSIENRDVSEDYNEEGRGTTHAEVMNIRSVGFPYIDQHDVVVTKDSKRYTVIKASNKYFPGTTLILLQLCTLQLVPNTDTIYSIPTPNFPDNNV